MAMVGAFAAHKTYLEPEFGILLREIAALRELVEPISRHFREPIAA